MDLPHTLADALEALTAARADLSALDALTTEHAALVAAHNTLTESHNGLQASLAEAFAKHETLLAELGTLKAEQQTAANQANSVLSGLGIDPVAIVPEQANAPRSSAELWAQYNALPLEQRNDFFLKNKEVMSR